MPRLFIAVDLPQDVREEVANLCFGVPTARWVKSDQFHLTLRFIGNVDDRAFHDITAALETIEQAPFSLRLRGVGHFPPRRDPRVLWVGVEDSEPLMGLHKSIERAVRNAGIEKEKRKFHPHITIARIRERTPVERVTGFLGANAMYASRVIPVNEFHLYSSLLKPEGAIHTREATFGLE